MSRKSQGNELAVLCVRDPLTGRPGKNVALATPAKSVLSGMQIATLFAAGVLIEHSIDISFFIDYCVQFHFAVSFT